MEKYFKKFEDFSSNQSGMNEASNFMDINMFSSAFVNFYDFIKENSKFMDDETKKHLKDAIKALDSAWENEADAHGVDFTPYKIKL